MGNILQLEHRDELTVDVYGDGVLVVGYLPRRLSKPMLKKIMEKEDSENWEDKADSGRDFIAGFLSWWSLCDVKRDEKGKPMKNELGQYINGDPIPLTAEMIETHLGFIGIRDVAKAVNEHYNEFMKTGEQKGSDSADTSAASNSSLHLVGTSSSEPPTEATP